MDAIVEQAVPGAPLLQHSFRFQGTGREYFRIWIVNLALSVVTLGVFSAWAKVRSARYFRGNTYVGEHNFDYHGQPLRILVGRAIALGILLAYLLAASFMPLVASLMVVAMFFATPWLVVAALRFNARNTSYRNIRFDFTGGYGGAFKAYIAWPLLAAITLGTTYPLARRARTHFYINHHRFGGRVFDCDIPVKSIYRVYFAALGLLVGLIVAAALCTFLFYLVNPPAQGAPPALSGSSIIGLMYLGMMLAVITFTGARVFNLALNHTMLAGHYRFSATLSARKMLGLVASNLLLTLCTLGLYYPWARVRTARYVAEHLSVLGPRDIEDFTSELIAGQSAIGEEVATFFEVDVGL